MSSPCHLQLQSSSSTTERLHRPFCPASLAKMHFPASSPSLQKLLEEPVAPVPVPGAPASGAAVTPRRARISSLHLQIEQQETAKPQILGVLLAAGVAHTLQELPGERGHRDGDTRGVNQEQTRPGHSNCSRREPAEVSLS